jgi:multiple antibiotic resistance protein
MVEALAPPPALSFELLRPMPDLATLLSAFVTLLVTIGPFETAAVFGALTQGMTPAERRRTALRAVIIAGIVLVLFALAGERLLSVLHVSLPALRTAGGILLFLEAINLMTAHPGTSSINPEERDEAKAPRDITVFPLAFPLIAGPGSLMAVILLMSKARGHLLFEAGILLIVGICLAITLLSYVMVDGLRRLLGVTGTDVVGRISGLLLAAMAMQFVFDGVTQGLLKTP